MRLFDLRLFRLRHLAPRLFGGSAAGSAAGVARVRLAATDPGRASCAATNPENASLVARDAGRASLVASPPE